MWLISGKRIAECYHLNLTLQRGKNTICQSHFFVKSVLYTYYFLVYRPSIYPSLQPPPRVSASSPRENISRSNRVIHKPKITKRNHTVQLPAPYLRWMSKEENMRGFGRPVDSPNTDRLTKVTHTKSFNNFLISKIQHWQNEKEQNCKISFSLIKRKTAAANAVKVHILLETIEF